MIARLSRVYLRMLQGLLLALGAAILLMVGANLVLRYGFDSGLTAAEELTRWTLVWIGFVGATIALAECRQMAALGVVTSLPPRVARPVLLLAQALSLGASVFFLVGAWQQVQLNMNLHAPVTGWSVGLALYGAGLFFAVHAVPLIAWQMLQLLRGGPARWQEG